MKHKWFDPDRDALSICLAGILIIAGFIWLVAEIV